MNEGLIAVRYAKALFLSAKEKKVLPVVFTDLECFFSYLVDQKELSSFLKSPVMSMSKKKEVINSVFKKGFNELTISFINLIIENRRENYINNIIQRFFSLYKENQNIKQAILTTVNPVSKAAQKKISELVKKAFQCEVEMDEKEDASILGGFVLRVDDQQFDASVASNLKRIHKQLLITQVDE